MNKIVLLILCFISFNIGAQDTLSTVKNNHNQKVVFTEKDVQIDSSAIVNNSFPKNFKKKYTDTPFIYEFKTPEKNAWDRFKEWLASIFKNIFNLGSNKISMGLVEVVLKIIAVLIIIFVIYLIVKSILNKEGQWIFGKNSDRKIINYNEIEKNLHLIDFEKLIKNTLQSGEQRLSIRYYYLWLLKKMAEKHLIIWDIEKTNSDYLYEIKSLKTKEEFEYLSYLYNNIWYGEFEIDDVIFEKAKMTFENAIKTIGNE